MSSSPSATSGVHVGDLDRVALHVGAAQKAARIAQHLSSPGMDPEELARAPRFAEKAAEETGAALATLKALGANTRQGLPADAPDLSDLALLDTPDARELLAVVEKAVEIAERVDASRGRSLPDAFPLQPGTDLAETLSEIALRLRIEVEGPKGRE